MTGEKEKVRLDNIALEDKFDKNFVDALKKEFGDEITLAGIVLIHKPVTPIIVNHETQKEVEDKVIHIQSPDGKLIDRISNVMKQVK
ncbi:MAG TPA: hypothetical protein VJB11_01665 [archaeon]|nr:hypothetical protein [archaeon]